jgi:hypothetical protein
LVVFGSKTPWEYVSKGDCPEHACGISVLLFKHLCTLELGSISNPPFEPIIVMQSLMANVGCSNKCLRNERERRDHSSGTEILTRPCLCPKVLGRILGYVHVRQPTPVSIISTLSGSYCTNTAQRSTPEKSMSIEIDAVVLLAQPWRT